MAEYDLGTAHGRIEIESDTKGADDAEKDLRRLEAASHSLSGAFGKLQGGFGGLSDRMRNSARDSDVMKRSMQGLTDGLHAFGRMAETAGGKGLKAIGDNLDNIGKRAHQAIPRIYELKEALDNLGSVSGILRNIGSHFGDTDSMIAGLPGWQRNIVGLSGALEAYGWAWRSLNKNMVVAGGVSLATKALAKMSLLLSPMVAKIGLVNRAVGRLHPVLGVLTDRLANAGVNTQRWGAYLTRLGKPMVKVVSGLASMVVGHAKMNQGLQYFTRFAMTTVTAMTAMIGAAGGLKIIGSTILGIVNAAKQLSGIAVLLPGAIMGIGVAAGVAALAMKGMKEAFKASTLEGEEFTKAVDKLSPTMRSVAFAAKDLKGNFTELQNAAADSTFQGFGEDMRNLARTYIPTLKTGIFSVGNALNQVKNGFRDFLISPATVNDVNAAFADTAHITRNLSKAVWPLMAAFRDLASVGLEAFSEMTGGAGNAAKRFADFISEARRTGEIRSWIDESIQGFKDLGTVLSNLGSMAKTIFTAFGASGENALARAAAATERWAVALDKSAESGAVRTLIDFLQRISGTAIEVLTVAFEALVRIMQDLAPLSEQISETFGHTLVTSIGIVSQIFEAFASNLEDFGPILGFLIGHFLAHVAALKLLALAVAPVIAAFKILAGAFALFKGFAMFFTGITQALKKSEGVARVYGRDMGLAGAAVQRLAQTRPLLDQMQHSYVNAARAATAFGGASRTAARGAGAMAAAGTLMRSAVGAAIASFGGATIALIAVTTAITAISGQSQKWNQHQELMAKRADLAAGSVKKLAAAFDEANGKVDANVIATLSQNLEDMRAQIDAEAAQTISTMDKIGAGLADAFNFTDYHFGEGEFTDQNQAIEETARKAQGAQKALDSLGITQERLTEIAHGSESGFIATTQRLREQGDGGKYAAEQLQAQRTAFLVIADSMARIGPGAMEVSNAMQTLGDKASTTADRLDAVKQALQGLGLLQVSELEAVTQAGEAIEQMGATLEGIVVPAEAMGAALFKADGSIEAMSPNAKGLYAAIGPLSESLQSVAASGGDVQGVYAQMGPQLDAVAQKFGYSREEIDAWSRQIGLAPRELTFIASIVGTDDVKAQVSSAILLISQETGKTFDINLEVKDEDARNKIRDLGGTVTEINATTGEVRITGNTDDFRNKMNEIINAPPPPPTEVPVTTEQAPPPPPPPPPPPIIQPTETEPAPAPAPPPPPPPIHVQTTSEPTPAPAPPPPQEVKVKTTTEPAPAPEMPPPPAPIRVTVAVEGVTEVNAQIDSIKGPIDGVIGKFGEMAGAFEGAMGQMIAAASNMASQVASTLANASSGAYNSGAAVGQGFADGINSKVGAVAAAAGALAAAAAAPLPKSPAEIGPFSGRGWTPYRGKALAEGFAEGIEDGTPGTAMAALDMAKAVDGAMESLKTALKLPVYSQNERYVSDMTKTQEQLRQENFKRIEERQKEEARSAKREAQNKAKEEAKKTPEERTAEAEKAAKPAGEKKPEDIAKENREEQDKAEQERFDKSYQLLQDGIGTDAQINEGIDDLNRKTTGLDEETKQQVRILSNQNSSLQDQLAALEGIDNSINRYEDIDTQDYLKQIRDSAMQRGGIQEYERPVSTDIPKDVQDTIKNVFDLLDKFEQTGKNFMDLFTLLSRGLSSTKDVMDAVDSFQSLVSSVMDIAETVGQVVSTVASVGAAFGAMIPGIGQVLAGISAVTGGVSSVNGIVDLIQQGFKIAGRIGGTILSHLAGGAEGALYGTVRTLVDTNDKTIKRWSEDNAMDKRSTSYDVFGNKQGTDNSKKYNFQIYQGPGQDPYRMMDEAVFAMRAADSGAYSV